MNGLIPTEREQLDELERVIERGLDSFIEVGTALATVRDRKLYKDEHGTFEAYCESRWSLSRKRAYDLMDAAGTVAALSPMGDTPAPGNERQARELTGLAPEVAADVMRAAGDATEGKKITAGAIREAREQIAPRARVTETTKTEYDVDTVTGEVDPPTSEPQQHPSIAEIVKDAQNRPSLVAYKAVVRFRDAYKTVEAIGGVDAIIADLSEPGSEEYAASARDRWVIDLDRAANCAAAWAAALRRSGLRRVQ